MPEKTPSIRFIVPFSPICKYRDDDGRYVNFWNNIILYKSEDSFLFCNIDTKNFYKWWNFAIIIDFKWRTFGRSRYYWIGFFYFIFFLLFMLDINVLDDY